MLALTLFEKEFLATPAAIEGLSPVVDVPESGDRVLDSNEKCHRQQISGEPDSKFTEPLKADSVPGVRLEKNFRCGRETASTAVVLVAQMLNLVMDD